MKQIHLLLPVLLSFMLVSCKEQQKLTTDVYTTSLKLSDKIIETFMDIENINNQTYYQQALSSILSNSDSLIDFKPVLQNRKDIEIFIAYKDFLLNVYNYFSNSKEKTSIQEIKNEVKSLLTLIDSLHPNEYTEQTQKIQKLLNNPKTQLNYLHLKILELLDQLLHNDVKCWLQSLDSAYNVYSYKLKQIPNSVFDIEKLQKFIYQPYKGEDKLIKIYKQNLRQEAMIYKNKFKGKCTGAYISLIDLKEIINEMTKQNPDVSFIYYKLTKIKAYTNTKTISPNEK